LFSSQLEHEREKCNISGTPMVKRKKIDHERQAIQNIGLIKGTPISSILGNM
jgi:hypothetical protein